MEHLREYRAAAAGKRRGSKAGQNAPALAFARRLIFAVATLLFASMWGSASHAQSGPFAGMAGIWSGSGIVTLDDGSTERIRCRATYAVGAGGNGLEQTLTCASDSYKFNLSSNVMAQGLSHFGDMERKQPEYQRKPRGTLRRRQFSGHCNLAWIYRAPLPDDARQQADRRDQGREPIQGRLDFAVPHLSAEPTAALFQFPPASRWKPLSKISAPRLARWLGQTR